MKPGLKSLPYLRLWRENANLTRAALAVKANMNASAIAKIELKEDHPARYSTVETLAKALDITPEELLYKKPAPMQVQFTA